MIFKLPTFKNRALFEQAMTHKSYVNECGDGREDNERLEFLGDALLNFLSGEFLYKEYPLKPEGELTQIRAGLVDKNQLTEFALKLGLDQRILLGKGVENSGGRENPRLLSSAFEALIGAYFLDQNSDVNVVRPYVEGLFQWALTQKGVAEQTLNFKSQLQAWALAEIGEVPQYDIVREFGPDHAKQFISEVSMQGKAYGQGQGTKKQEAEKAAARSALEQLGLL
jgi:ribonuclease-3